MVEIELKLSVSVEDLPLLAPHLPGPIEVKNLRNIYFDTPARGLEATRRMLRLRLVGGHPGGILCYKGPSENQDGVFRADELEWPLSRAEATAFLEAPMSQGERLAELFPGVDLHSLESFGEIRVQRTVYRLASNLELEMDLVEFSDGSRDAELEVEAPEARMAEARASLGRVLERAGVHATVQTQTKYQRFLSRLGRS